MRKVKAKRLRQLARKLQSPEIPGVATKRIYKVLKGQYRDGLLPKDLRFKGEA